VLIVAIVMFALSLWLANRLVGRLKRLRNETLALADERLPETMRRLGAGEEVDAENEAAHLDFGNDEIGSVADAFNRAHTAAVAAAVAEARTRQGVRAVFLNIAHRSQIVVHRQLELLDEAERRQEDPALLDTFFRLDHLATRERRNAENLIILGGGEPGRQWRRPVPLMELVRSAVGETLDYARVRAGRMPAVFVHGNAVADLIHLLAELVDNATSFSPPQSRVDLAGNLVGKGVVVEINDQGMGMPAAERERANDMLREPPDFGVATLSANSRLGLFVVAQLAARHGISVRLSDSDYGGVRAIVLVPTTLITTDTPVADHLPDRFSVQRIEAPATGEFPARSLEPAAALPTAAPVIEQIPDEQDHRPPYQGRHYPDQQVEDRPDHDPLPDRSFADRPNEDQRFQDQQTDDMPYHASQYAESQFTQAPPTGSHHVDTGFHEVRFPEPSYPETSPRGSELDEPNHRQPTRPPSYTSSDTRPPLPRRRKQASLAPELANQPPAESSQPRHRSAEQARDLMSSIENGTRQGRRAHRAPDPAITPDEQEGEGDFFQRR
jgi:signal transduction histidine kinase